MALLAFHPECLIRVWEKHLIPEVGWLSLLANISCYPELWNHPFYPSQLLCACMPGH